VVSAGAAIMARVIPLRPLGDAGEEELIRAGWRKQSTLSEPRLSEVAEGYRSMGYEVHLQPYRAGPGCNTCFDAGEALGQKHATVWIRGGGSARGDDELFD